jgi:hypothetical protein
MLRFWQKVDVVPGGCWHWTAPLDWAGYGRFNAGPGRTNMQAYKWAYETFIGPVPEGLVLDHLCRVRHCVNPYHLEAVTQHENIMRGDTVPAANARKTHCPQGHPYDEENTIINHRGSRECRICVTARRRRRRANAKD